MGYDEIVRLIKRILRNEKAIRQAVAEKRAAMTKKEETAGRAPGHVSKPTEVAAMQNLTPIDFVYFCAGWKKEKIKLAYPEMWLACLDEVRASLTPWEQRFMAAAFVSQDWEICAELGIARTAFYAMKKEIVSQIAIRAARAGIIEV